MASNINPNLINTSYPVAGQDNSTQGFRTNFAAIKTNFEYAEDEIEALQDSAAVIDGANDFAGNLIFAAELRDIRWTKLTRPAATGTVNLDFRAAAYYALVTAGSVSINFSNFATASTAGYLRLSIVISNVSHTLTLSAPTLLLDVAGIQGYSATNNSTGTITFAATGTYQFEFVTTDGGSTIAVNQLNQSLTPLNASSEDLAAGAAASLAVTTSYFATAAAETATLATGVNGQIKVLAMTADLGDMVITVTHPGWNNSATGTITFSDLGDACTLMYTTISIAAGSFITGRIYTISSVGSTNFTVIGASSNTVGTTFTATGVGAGTGTATTGSWYCIGNNGTTFA